MTRHKKPTHDYVSSTPPNDWQGGGQNIEVALRFKAPTDPRTVFSPVFYFEVFMNGQPAKPRDDMHFGIVDDCTIAFKMPEPHLCRFSSIYYPVTSKSMDKDLYGGVVFDEQNQTLTLLAKKNKGALATHQFNLNIEVAQEGGRWLQVTLDPDIINPKPDPFIVAGEGDAAAQIPLA